MHLFIDIAALLYAFLFKEATWHLSYKKDSAMHSLFNVICSDPFLTLLGFTKLFQIKSNAFDTVVGIGCTTISGKVRVSPGKPFTLTILL